MLGMAQERQDSEVVPEVSRQTPASATWTEAEALARVADDENLTESRFTNHVAHIGQQIPLVPFQLIVPIGKALGMA